MPCAAPTWKHFTTNNKAQLKAYTKDTELNATNH